MHGGNYKMKNLNELLNSYKVAELKEIAKNSGVKGYSKLKKSELIDIIINDNAETVAANIVSAVKNDENEHTESNSTLNDSDDGVIKLKNHLFGVAPLMANVIPDDMPAPCSNTPDSFMQIKKIYPNDKCPCGSGKKYKPKDL